MAKSQERILAQKMRKEGKSIKDIAKSLHVSSGSVSVWCKDITLSTEQIQKLHDKMICSSYKGRLIGAKMQAEKKRKRIQQADENAKAEFEKITKRELFILGIGLYWGEGSKNNGVRFFNSDPASVRVMMQWFRECLNISEERFSLYITVNEIHKKRISEIIQYWSRVTKIPIKQFKNPIFIQTQNKKVYKNFSNHYGTLSIRIRKSYTLLYQILAWIRALDMPG